jgi:hypothetical protein
LRFNARSMSLSSVPAEMMGASALGRASAEPEPPGAALAAGACCEPALDGACAPGSWRGWAMAAPGAAQDSAAQDSATTNLASASAGEAMPAAGPQARPILPVIVPPVTFIARSALCGLPGPAAQAPLSAKLCPARPSLTLQAGDGAPYIRAEPAKSFAIFRHAKLPAAASCGAGAEHPKAMAAAGQFPIALADLLGG